MYFVLNAALTYRYINHSSRGLRLQKSCRFGVTINKEIIVKFEINAIESRILPNGSAIVATDN